MTTKKKKLGKNIKILFLDSKSLKVKEVQYTGNETINKLLKSKSFKTQLRKFRDTTLTIYYDPEQQGIDQAPISIIGCKAMETDTSIYGNVIVASTTDAGYIGSLKKEQIQLLEDLARYVHWRWHEDTVYYGVMTVD
jgi:hypothetical protein